MSGNQAVESGVKSTVLKGTFLGSAFRGTGVIMVVAAAVGAIFVGITALHLRAENAASPQSNPPIAVATQAVKWSDHYTTTRGYIGRLEAGRETAAAFERGGLVLEIGYDEGDAVKKGDVLARLDTARLEANRRELQAQRQEFTAQRDLARLTLERQNTLQSRGWSPEQRYDEARFSVSRLNAAIARVDAAIDALEVDFKKSEILTPFDGTVAARHLDEGAVVAAGTTVLEIIESGSPQARIGIAPEAAGGLKVGNIYRITAGDRQLEATLRAMRVDLEAGSRTVTALFTLADTTDAPLGEVAVLNLERRVDVRGVWLPLAALAEGRKGLWSVMLAGTTAASAVAKHTIRRETVEVLHVAGDRAFVRGAFKNGDRVVTAGVNRVTPGQRVVLAKLQ